MQSRALVQIPMRSDTIGKGEQGIGAARSHPRNLSERFLRVRLRGILRAVHKVGDATGNARPIGGIAALVCERIEPRFRLRLQAQKYLNRGPILIENRQGNPPFWTVAAPFVGSRRIAWVILPP